MRDLESMEMYDLGPVETDGLISIMTIDEITIKAQEYRMILARAKQLVDEAEAIKLELIEELKSRNIVNLQTSVHTISLLNYYDTRVDILAMKKDIPEIVGKYSKTINMCSFAVI